MAEHNDFGKRGEKLACEYLVNKGFEIMETNWQVGNYEIDIIAANKHFITFIEVKTRHSSDFGEPEEFVTKQKQKFIIRAAGIYIEKNKINKEVRFDIISVLVSEKKSKINHIEDAFYPTI